MNVRKIVGLLALALLLFWVVTQPESAARGVGKALGILGDIANGIVTFLSLLF